MKVLANDGIASNAIEKLSAAGFDVLTTKVAQDQLANYINQENIEALLVRSATKVRKDLIDACPGLKLIGRGGVGMDNIDVDYAKGKGIHVINTPASSSQSVAELVLAHLSGMVRFLPDSNRQMPLEGDSKFNDLKKAYAKGIELQGKTIGILGFGRIGQALAKLCIGLGMRVAAYDRKPGKEVGLTLSFFDGQTASFTVVTQSLEEVLAQSDFLSIHVPGGDGQALLGERELGLMKKGAFLVNAARGGVVDEPALLQALESGHLAGAALDVFENEPAPAVQVLMHPALSLTPHIGAATEEAQDRIGLELADTLIELLKPAMA